jgi:hypothetical protein
VVPDRAPPGLAMAFELMPVSAKTLVPVRTGVALCLPVHRARNGHELLMRSPLSGALRRRDVQERWIASAP